MGLDIEQAKVWMINNQQGRRNLTDGWKWELAQEKKMLLVEKGKENLKTPTGGKSSLTLSTNDKVNHDTRKEIATELGWSTGKVAQADVVWKEAPEELKEAVKSGEETIGGAYRKLREAPKVQLSPTKDQVESSTEAPSDSLPSDEQIPARKDIALRMSESNEWYTPAKYIEAVRGVLGAINLDPASCEHANKTVKAEKIFTIDDDGLTLEWHGKVFCNPPYGGFSGPFTAKLLEEYQTGRVSEAILLVNANSTDTQWFRPLWEHTLCFTDHRINYYSPSGNASGSTHGSVFIYLGDNVKQFIDVFSEFGPVVQRVKL